jgi:hypothetical protein
MRLWTTLGELIAAGVSALVRDSAAAPATDLPAAPARQDAN